MTGIVVAILYLIVKKEEQKQLSIDDLIKAANEAPVGVSTKRTVKVTVKMIQKYIKLILSLIDMSLKNNNTNDSEKSIMDHMRRLSLKLQMSTQVRSKMNKRFKDLPSDVKSAHNPSTVAKTVVYLFSAMGKNNEYETELRAKL